MGPKLNVKSARTAAVSMKTRLLEQEGGFKHIALLVGVFAAGLLGFVGLGAVGAGISFAADRTRNASIAEGKKQVLADELRVPIAAQLGISSKSVTTRDLELAAQVNPTVRNAIAKVKKEKDDNNRAALAAAGAGVAAGWIPGVGALTSTLAQGAVHMGGAVAGDLGSRALFNKDIVHTLDIYGVIQEKHAKGEAVSTADMFMLRMAQNEQLQADIKKRTGGHAFHKMNPEQQEVVMQAMPDQLAAAEKDAKLLNEGRAQPSMLLMHSPGASSGWAQRVGGNRAPAGSFTQQVSTERAQAAQGIAVPSL